MKICHVINGLDEGGAETVLFRLIESSPDLDHVVVSLSGWGKYGGALQSIGVDVIDADMGTSGRKLLGFKALVRLIKGIEPDAIQTWMYQSDLLGGIAGRIAGCRNVAWSIHNSMVGVSGQPLGRFAIIRICALLSHLIPRAIVSCSQVALRAHEGIGYSDRKLVFVPNGCPIDIFYPRAMARNRIRTEFGVGQSEVLLGIVARLDPQKDYENLLNALEILKGSNHFKCLLIGAGLDAHSRLLPGIESRGLLRHVRLVGQRSDIPDVMNALDIFVLSSRTEAFPVVLTEAMACGIPCVTTDVGDSGCIVGDTGWVVPPQSPMRLARALSEAVTSLPDHVRQAAARRRIVDNFSVEGMAEAYRRVWLGCRI